jgi:phosphoglycerate dehydrogenase-like enzyme
LNDAELYEQALARKGLAERFELHLLKMDEPIPNELAERAEVLVGWRPGEFLKRMPRLRWIQTMTAGVEAWLEHPGLRRDDTLS